MQNIYNRLYYVRTILYKIIYIFHKCTFHEIYRNKQYKYICL